MKDLEQLVRYLDGELSDSQRNELIGKLQKDPSLLEKLEQIRDVNQLLGDKHLESFEETLKEVEALYAKSKNTKNDVSSLKIPLHTFKQKWTAAAAIIIILVSAAAYIVFRKTTPPSGPKLFAAYYEKLPADFGTRSLETGNDDFNEALKLYNSGKYEEAIREFGKSSRRSSMDHAAELFRGLCYLEMSQENRAAGEFRKVIKSQDPAFEEHASWYLALYYIKTGKNSLARPLLQKLVGTRSFYMEKASGLLKEIQ